MAGFLGIAVAACARGEGPAPAVSEEVPAAEAPTDLAAYELELDTVEKFFQAARELSLNPQVMDAVGDSEDETLEGAVRRLEESAEARRLIESSGLSVRDYVLTGHALFQALLAQSAMEAGMPSPPADSLHPANLEFVAEHRELLEQGFAELGITEE